MAGTTQIIRRIKQNLNLPYVDQVGHLAADFAADNLQAYELYINGLEYLSIYDYENASELLQSAIDEAPQFGIAKYRLAQILEATGRNTEAYQLLNSIDVDTLSEREKLYVAGDKQEFAENRNTARAIVVFQELVSKFPFDSEAQQKLAEAYWLDYQNEASVEQLEQLVELHPKEAVSWMALGERQIDVGDNAGARVSLAKYISMRPDDPYAHTLLGELASRERQISEARAHYRQALTIRPGMGLPLLGIARLAYFEDQYDEALSLWNEMIGDTDITADYRIDAAFDYAHALRALGMPQEAFDAFSTVEAEIQGEGFREALALTVKAEVLFDLGQPVRAKELLNDAIDKSPASRQPIRQYFYLAQIALQENSVIDFSEIIETMLALPIKPNSLSDNDRTAATHYLTALSLIPENPDLAVSTFERALGTPDHFAYRLYELGLAEALAAAGQFAIALDVLDGIGDLDSAAPRLDLEYDQRLKQVLRAEILSANGRSQESRDIANQFIAAWPNAALEHPVMQRVEQLLSQD